MSVPNLSFVGKPTISNSRKMSKFLFVLCIAFVAVQIVVSSATRCRKKNEVYTCGTQCERNCDNRYLEFACVDDCINGCFCRSGYIRRSESDETCIPVYQCGQRG